VYPDVELREVDIQTDPETADECGVGKISTTLVYANGERTPEFIGGVGRDGVEAAIERADRHSTGSVYRLASIGGR
jgi:hypothetical protein